MEDWVTIRNLKKRNANMGTRKIAELLGVSRNTVKRALEAEEYPAYERPSKINDLLEPFAEFIKESYVAKRQRVSVIISNLRSKGFSGSGISVYRYIAANLKEEKELGSTKAYMPYSTIPGEQMLYDWAEYSLLLGSVLVKIYVHMTLFGYSRYRIYSASLSIRQSDVFEALEDAFVEIGGICMRIQVDNAKAFVDNASVNDFKWNKRFLSFCGYYGIKPSRSLPGHPWSKGKVENPFDYLEHHFITNNTFFSFEDFAVKLKAFQQQVNDRIHGATGKAPAAMLAVEKDHLLELPWNLQTGAHQRYIGFKEEFRKVTSDCLISFGGNRYSVPHRYVKSEVWVRVSQGYYLQIHSKANSLIATHILSAGKGNVIINKEHYRGYRSNSDRASFAVTAQKLRARFENCECIDGFIHSVQVQKRINPAWHLTRIREIFDDYHEEDCLRCIRECTLYNAYSYHFVKGFLLANASMKMDVAGRSHSLQEYRSVNVTRDLKEYRL